MIDFLYYVVVLELFIGKSKSSNLERLSNPPPYKSYCEFPKNCPDLKFSGSTMSQEELRKEYYKCQSKHIDRWKITTSNYYTETREFCCFVKTVLTCEKPILTLCDKTYSQLNEDDTERLFGKSCNQFTCDETDTNLMSEILKWVLFIGGGILSALMLYCAGRYGYEKGKEWWELRNMDPKVREKLEATRPFVTKQTELELSQLKAAADLAALDNKLKTENSKWKFYRKYKLGFENILRNRKLKQQAKKNIELEMKTNPEVFWKPLINENAKIGTEKSSQLLESLKSTASALWDKAPTLESATSMGRDALISAQPLADKFMSGSKSALEKVTPLAQQALKNSSSYAKDAVIEYSKKTLQTSAEALVIASPYALSGAKKAGSFGWWALKEGTKKIANAIIEGIKSRNENQLLAIEYNVDSTPTAPKNQVDSTSFVSPNQILNSKTATNIISQGLNVLPKILNESSSVRIVMDDATLERLNEQLSMK